MRALWCIPLVMVLAACRAMQPTSPDIQCHDPRPQVCTMEYDPVCATLHKGGSKQYSSGCNACADDAVASYLPDPCPSEAS